MSTFEKTQVTQAQSAPAYPQETLHYSDRQFLHTQNAGVVVPLLQAMITSGLLAFGVLILSWVFEWSSGWKVALVIFGVMPFFSWLFLQRRWLVLTAEKVMQRDLNGDGVVESSTSHRTEPRLVKVQVNHIKEGGSLQVDLISLPCTDSQLRKLAEGLLNGIPFTEGAWSGGGKPFSVAEIKLLRSVMLARGLLKPRSEKDQRQGFELTEEGRAVMEGSLDSK
jgi:hypothetical protein